MAKSKNNKKYNVTRKFSPQLLDEIHQSLHIEPFLDSRRNIIPGRITEAWKKDPQLSRKVKAPNPQTIRNFLERGQKNSFEYGSIYGLCWIALKRDLDLDDSDNNSSPQQTEVFINEIKNQPNESIENLTNSKPYTILMGRDEEISEIKEILTESSNSGIVVIDGLGGVGKTSLAYEISIQLLRDDCVHKVIWESFKINTFNSIGFHSITGSFTQTINRDNLLDSLCFKLNHNESYSLPYEGKYNLLKNILNNERILIVLDNLETVEDYQLIVQEIKGLFSFSKAIITSRNIIHGIQEIRKTKRLEGLSFTKSISFMKSYASKFTRANEVISNASENQLENIHTEITGGLPLAIELIVGKLEFGESLDQILSKLKSVKYKDISGNNITSDLDIYQQFYKFIYADSWDKLSENGKSILIGLCETEPIRRGTTPQEIKSICYEISSSSIDNAISELIQLSLVKEKRQGTEHKIFVHPLTYLFANEIP